MRGVSICHVEKGIAGRWLFGLVIFAFTLVFGIVAHVGGVLFLMVG